MRILTCILVLSFIVPIGKVIFINSYKLEKLKRIANARIFSATRLASEIRNGLDALGDVHGIGMGVPSEKATDNIKWKAGNYDDMGLIWYSPTVAANGKLVRDIVEIAEDSFSNHGFDFPVSFTLVRPDRIVGIISISFNKNDSGEKERAHNLYYDLKHRCENAGIHPYRSSVPGMDELKYNDQGKSETLRMLKNVFDPNNIISPGRYGIQGSI